MFQFLLGGHSYLKFSIYFYSWLILLQYTFFSVVTHVTIAHNISLEKFQTNYCNNNLLILDVKKLNKIIKLYYFHNLKALWYGQGKIKM